MSIALIGYRGSGKTTVGKLVAQALGWEFIDSDERLVQKAGKSIKQIFEESGEERFRDLETETLQEVLALKDHVIALGGGAVKREGNRKLLRDGGHLVVYLHCNAQELARRIESDVKTKENRPNLTGLGGGLKEVEALLAEREPIYRAIDDWEIDVSGLNAGQVASAIVKRVRG